LSAQDFHRDPQGPDHPRAHSRHCAGGASQIIFVDTPGIFSPKRKLDEEMVAAAWAGAAEADATVLLIDARDGLNEANRKIIEGLQAAGLKPCWRSTRSTLYPMKAC
jgi:GTP-binding protein Era